MKQIHLLLREYRLLLQKKLQYEIKDVKVEEDVCDVDVEIETIDFKKLFETAYQEALKEYGETKVSKCLPSILEKHVKDDAVATLKDTYQVNVHSVENDWKIEMDSEFANALTGGMNAYIESLQGGE